MGTRHEPSPSAPTRRVLSGLRTLSLALAAGAGIALAAAAPAHAVESPLDPLVLAAGQRLLIADDAAGAKWGTPLPINDPPREKQVLDTVTNLGVKSGLDRSYVHQVFRDQIDATEAIEYARFAQWKLLPHTAPTVRPDLSAARATIDGLNVTMVDQLARQRSVLAGPACRADLTVALANTVVRAHLGADYAAALTRATASYCTPNEKRNPIE